MLSSLEDDVDIDDTAKALHGGWVCIFRRPLILSILYRWTANMGKDPIVDTFSMVCKYIPCSPMSAPRR